MALPAWGAAVYWRSNTTERDAITGMAAGDFCLVLGSDGQHLEYVYSGSAWVLPTWGASGFTQWSQATSDSATYGGWLSGGQTFTDVNADSRPNHVLSVGYNIGANGGPSVADQPAFRVFGAESHYNLGADPDVDVFELHIGGYYPASSSTEQRAISMYVNKATGAGGITYQFDTYRLANPGATKWVDVAPASTITIHSVESRNSDLEWRIQNTDNTSGHSGAHAELTIMTAGANGGDPFMRFNVDNAQSWSMGIDNSDSDAFKISAGWGLGDANNIRIPVAGGIQIATGTKGTCDASARGTIYYVAGGAGVADTLEVCRKDASNNYAWASLF